MISKRSFIYDIKLNDWTEGPSLLKARCKHSSCVVQSADGTIKAVIILGGEIHHQSKRENADTTEIFLIKERKWIQGPKLPNEMDRTTCVALPFSINYHCIVIGGMGWGGIAIDSVNPGHTMYENVYGLGRSLTAWTFLGRIERKKREYHIALPIS